MMSFNSGELDNLISSVPHARFITCPVFGAPAVAAKGLLIAVMSGDYRSKKDVAYLLVPAVAQKIIDLGGNVEKGLGIHFLLQDRLKVRTSPNVQAYRKFFDPRNYRSHGRILDPRRKGRCRFQRRLGSPERSVVRSFLQIYDFDADGSLDLFPAPMCAYLLCGQFPTNGARS